MPPPALRLARQAMATRFEVVIHHSDAIQARAAGEEALEEVERLEEMLSYFRPTSQVAALNARAAHEAVPVSAEFFSLLERALKISRETGGAFDLTVAPLIRHWGLNRHRDRDASQSLEQVLELLGPDRVILDPGKQTVRFDRPGVELDFGAVGKGFALETAAQRLREAGIESALLHGGTSTVVAIGSPPGEKFWKIGLEGPPGESEQLLGQAGLCDQSLSVSAVWGKEVMVDGRKVGHVLDPRTGEPVQQAELAGVILPSATESDAFSTALLTQGSEGLQRLKTLRPQMEGLVAKREGNRWNLQSTDPVRWGLEGGPENAR